MRAFVVTVSTHDIDIASDLLWRLGVRAIEERSTSGAVELWTAVGDDDASIARAASELGERWEWRAVEVIDAAADTWRQYARPMWVDDGVVVLPAWMSHPAEHGVTAVSIEPGGAFGLGDHPTTLLSLRCLRRELVEGTGVLDVGCGTGVIAVMAAKLGAGSVRAVDVASAAAEATRDNALRNGVADLVDVDTRPLADLETPCQLVVANILAPTLIELADDLMRLTVPGGRLVISGILADRHDHVLAALEPMIVERTDVLDGWAAVTLSHPRRHPTA